MVGERFRIRGATVDLARRQITRDGESTPLTTKEAAVLQYLAARVGRSVSRDELLREIWGFRVAVETRAVDNVVRRLRSKLGEDARSPTGLYTTHGEGYCLRFDAEARPPRTVFGREPELEALHQAWIRGVRLVTVLAGPGFGKSTLLAEHVARLRAEGLDIGWASVGSGRSEADISVGVARALGLGHLADLGAAIRGRGPLGLVIDDGELAPEPLAGLVGRWLAEAPELRVWIAARHLLPLEGDTRLELGPLPTAAAADLFRARAARAADWSWEQTTALVRHLDGHPLAIELAAGRSRVVGPEDLLVRVRAMEQPRSLQASIAASWAPLDAETRAAWARCALLPASFDLAAAEAVLEGEADVVERLESLTDRFLIHPAPGAPGRLQIYAAFRAFGLARLAEMGEVEQVEARLSAYVGQRALALTDAVAGPAPRPALDAIEADLPMFDAVRRTGAPADRCRVELAVRAWSRLRAGAMVDGIDEAIALARVHAPELLARLLCERGHNHRLMHRLEEARADGVEAVTHAVTEADATRARAHLAGTLRDLASPAPDPRSDALFDESAALAVDPRIALSVRYQRVRVPINPALTLEIVGELQEILTQARALRLPLVEVPAGAALGMYLRHLGRPLDAAAAYEHAAEVAAAVGWRTYTQGLAVFRADVALALGRPEHARGLLEGALPDVLRSGHLDLVGNLLGTLGAAELALDCATAANDRLTAALERVRPLGDHMNLEILHLLRAAARARMGHVGEARIDWGRAVALRPLSHGQFVRCASLVGPYMDWEADRPARDARERLRSALEAFGDEVRTGAASGDADAIVVADLARRALAGAEPG